MTHHTTLPARLRAIREVTNHDAVAAGAAPEYGIPGWAVAAANAIEEQGETIRRRDAEIRRLRAWKARAENAERNLADLQQEFDGAYQMGGDAARDEMRDRVIQAEADADALAEALACMTPADRIEAEMQSNALTTYRERSAG